MADYCFLPDPTRGAQLDQDMHAALSESLQHIAEQTRHAVPKVATALKPVLEHLKAGGRYDPAAFGSYFALAEALFSGALAEAEAAASQLAAMGPAQPLRVVGRGTPDASEIDDVLNQRLGEGADRFAPVDKATTKAFSQLLDEGLALIAEGAPDLHGEVTAILRQVVCATDPAGAKLSFDGASHYQFWGLLLLNPKHHTTPLAMAEVLAHEAGHSLLFGMTINEPLTLNPDEETFPSPLRADPRPMDGIYHATYVSARMAWVMETLAASGILNADQRAHALHEAQKDRENFASGYGVVAQHGKLSEPGRTIIENARAWVEGG